MCTILNFPTATAKSIKATTRHISEVEKKLISEDILQRAKDIPTYTESFYSWYANFIFEAGGEVRCLRVEKQLRASKYAQM